MREFSHNRETVLVRINLPQERWRLASVFWFKEA